MKTNYEALLEMGWEELADRGYVRVDYTPDMGAWKVTSYYRLPYVTQWALCMTHNSVSAPNFGELLDCDEVAGIRYQAVLDFRRCLKKLFSFLQDSED